MIFNDVSGGTGLIQDCESWTNLGATGISSNTALLKDFTRRINRWYHKVETMILRAQNDWDFDDSNKTNYPILTTNLVASQQDYTLPTGTLKIKRVEVAYDGTNWKIAEPLDIDEVRTPIDTTNVAANYTTDEPKYDLIGNALFLYPIPSTNRTSCLKIWTSREPSEFSTSDTTTEPGFDEPFHEFLSVGASYDYAVQHNLPNVNALRNELVAQEARINDYYKQKTQNKIRRMEPNQESNR